MLISVLFIAALAEINYQNNAATTTPPVAHPCPPPTTPSCPTANFVLPCDISCNQEFIATLNVDCNCDFELTNGDICQVDSNGDPFGCYGCERILENGEIRSMRCLATAAGPWILLGAYLPDNIGCPVNTSFVVGCCNAV